EVRDDGPGMTPEVRARCTEPYFTTKRAGSGMGLGLCLVEGLLRRFKGALEIESEPGRGTACTMVVPVARNESSPIAITAAVSVGDPRMNAVVRAAADSIGMPTSAAPVGKGPPSAAVWVVDSTVPDGDLRRFIESGGRVLAMEERPEI